MYKQTQPHGLNTWPMPKAKSKRRKGAKAGSTRTIPAKDGKPAIKYKVGSLHKATGTPQGQKIPKAKLKKALAGGYGAAAKKKAELAVNVFGVKK